MAVRIRLKRAGRKHIPFYHIVVHDIRQKRDGAAIERLGSYDPANKEDAKQIVLDVERAAYWLSKGALPSDTATMVLKKAGCVLPEVKKVVAAKRVRKPRKPAAGVKPRTKKRTANSKLRSDRKKALTAKKAE